MSIRDRTWTTSKGEQRKAWIVDYFVKKDGKRVRTQETFETKADAKDFETRMRVEVRDGTHTARRNSITVEQAGKNWIKAGETAALERTTLDGYRQHLANHIEPLLGSVKLADLSVASVRDFEDRLIKKGCSRSLARKVRGSLGALLADAQERGHVARNVVRELRQNRRRGKEKRAEGRQKGKLRVGVDIPAPDEITKIITALPADGKWRSFFLVAIFCGLRASELRGLCWSAAAVVSRA